MDLGISLEGIESLETFSREAMNQAIRESQTTDIETISTTPAQSEFFANIKPPVKFDWHVVAAVVEIEKGRLAEPLPFRQ